MEQTRHMKYPYVSVCIPMYPDVSVCIPMYPYVAVSIRILMHAMDLINWIRT